MNWSNVLPILSILVPVFLGLWAIMRNIKEEIRSIKTELNHKIDNLDHKFEVVRSELKEDINTVKVELKQEINTVEVELKEENKAIRADMRSLQEMLWGKHCWQETRVLRTAQRASTVIYCTLLIPSCLASSTCDQTFYKNTR